MNRSVSPDLLRGMFRSAVGLESQPADGQKRKELEYVFYGKIVNFDELSKAKTVEHQEQWEIRNQDPNAPFEGNIRVRKSWTEHERGIVRFVLCAKTFQKEGKGRDEVEIEVSRDMFEQFKRLATGGMQKTRYCFPFEHEGHALMWEVDVYQDDNNAVVEWCKVDLEVPERLETIPEFPIQLTETITSQYDARTPEEKAKVDQLMKEHFVCQNAYLLPAV